jgi:tetratricopeptide (TPR) repeat protein
MFWQNQLRPAKRFARAILFTALIAIAPRVSVGGPYPAPGNTGDAPSAEKGPVTPPDPVGSKLMEIGNFTEAAAHYQRIVSREPDNVNACIGLGSALCILGRTDEAVKALDDCITRMPNQAGLYLERGLCRQSKRPPDLKRAEQDYRMALAVDPGNAPAHNQLGLLYQSIGNQDAAMTEFKAAIEADPDMFAAYNNLGASLIAVGDYNGAISFIQQAIKKRPALRGLNLYQNLGVAFLQAGKYGRAEAAFLIEIAINPDNYQAYINLGNLYVLSKRYDNAIYEYRRVLISDASNREALVNLGAAYVLAGKSGRAIEPLKKAVALYPDSALAHHYLGEAYRALGDADRARAEEEVAIKLGYQPDKSPWPSTPP